MPSRDHFLCMPSAISSASSWKSACARRIALSCADARSCLSSSRGQRALREILPRHIGKIKCMASVPRVIAQAGHSLHVASKGSTAQRVKGLALKAAPDNIIAKAIGSTTIKSDLVARTLEDPDKSREVLAMLPLGRLAELEDLVGAWIFLASGAWDYITGHLLIVDAGHTIP